MTTETTTLNPHEIIARYAKVRDMVNDLRASQLFSHVTVAELSDVVTKTVDDIVETGSMSLLATLDTWYRTACPDSRVRKAGIDTWMLVAERLRDIAAWTGR